MGHADCLRRLPQYEAPKDVPITGETILLMETIRTSPLDSEKIKLWTARDPVLSNVLRSLLQGRTIRPDECYIPFARRSGELTIQDGCIKHNAGCICVYVYMCMCVYICL